MPGTTTLAVLHGVRLGSVVGARELAARTGLPLEVVQRTLDACRDEGWLRHHGGRLPGYALTRSGRAEGERLLAEQVDRRGARSEIERAYLDFLPLNTSVLQICTDWQVVRVEGAEVPNDHRDDSHDLAVLGRLGRVHADARVVLRRLVAALARFGRYEPRLELALRRSVAGSAEWLTRPTIDSYHTVWFELHEDLLATLGRQRSEEAPAPGIVRGASGTAGTLHDPTAHTEEHA